MTENQIGYTIAIILLILLFAPMIIYRLYIYFKDKNNKDIFNNQNTYKYEQKQTYKPQYQQHNYQQQYEYFPYQLLPSVLTNHEKILYNILKEYCQNNKLALFSKVRIADFIEPIHKENYRNYLHWFNKISAKHIDFLICEPAYFKPLVAIELDDYTHKFNKRQERDVFVDNVYKSVNLPVIHFWDINEVNVRVQLNNILGIPNETKF